MKTHRLMILVAVVCAATLVHSSVRAPVASICAGELTVSATDRSGYTPHAVTVTVNVKADCNSQSNACALVDYGDGAQGSKCNGCFDCDYESKPNTVTFEEEHVYVCPGTYTFTASAPAGCPDCNSKSYDVVVYPAELRLFAWNNSKFGNFLVATRGMDLDHLLRSTVDWGDGSAPQEVTWTQASDGLIYAPHHIYPVLGVYTIRVKNEMEGPGCGWIQEAETTLNFALAVQNSTWGKVKALYQGR